MSHAFWCSRCVEQFIVMVPRAEEDGKGEVTHCPFCGYTDLGRIPVEQEEFIASMA
jgi:DNA-directed RNA polymerase subunit RPC12/RpoP